MKVTVLMPVYNVEKYVGEAIESILQQTFKDFEFIIIDDASTDQTISRIKDYCDKRIILLQNQKNIGLAASLNRGIDMAHGEYIARMDGDDMSCPDRLEKQVSYMDEHERIGVLGTWIRLFGKANLVNRYPLDDESCKLQLIFGVPFAHPSVMLRKSVLVTNDIYYDSRLTQYGEDYDLWFRLSNSTSFANLSEILLEYRTYSAVYKTSDEVKRIDRGYITREKVLASYNLLLSESEKLLLEFIAKKGAIDSSRANKYLKKSEELLKKLLNCLEKDGSISKDTIYKIITYHWFYFCYAQSSFAANLTYMVSSLKYPIKYLGFFVLMKFYIKPLISFIK